MNKHIMNKAPMNNMKEMNDERPKLKVACLIELGTQAQSCLVD
jgi:hypothetical protein